MNDALGRYGERLFGTGVVDPTYLSAVCRIMSGLWRALHRIVYIHIQQDFMILLPYSTGIHTVRCCNVVQYGILGVIWPISYEWMEEDL